MIKPGSPILISRDDLFDYVSQEEMFYRYVDNYNGVGQSFKSEFRKEGIPSSRVYEGKYGDLMFKDFGDPNLPKAISIIDYISYKFNLDRQAAINKVGIDFGLIKLDEVTKVPIAVHRNNKNKIKKGVFNLPSNLVIKIKKREWTLKDKEYWNSYYIPLTLLERNNIKSISHVFYGSSGYFTEFAQDHLVFSYDYYWNRHIFRRKIYQPTSKEDKWRTNTDYTVVQNYPNIPKDGGDTLYIQSSYKDCMVMEVMGMWAIAPNKEGSWFPDYYWEKLKERWKNIIIYWNNDWIKAENPGLNYAKHFSKLYDVPYILNPDGEPSDISDYVRKHDLEKGVELIKNLKLNKV